MKWHKIIRKVRSLSKRSNTVRKIIDFVPILGAVDRTGFVYSRVKEEEDKIIGYLSKSPRPVINLVCDLRCTPPSFGDFAAFLMAHRILNTRFEVKFIIRTDELQFDWDDLTQESQYQRLDHFKKLATGVANAGGTDLKIAKSLDELSALTTEGQTVFYDYVVRRKKIYLDLKHLNDLLYIQLGCTQNVLLDQVQFLKLETEPAEPYILWHIRQNSTWLKHYDASEKEIIDQYTTIRTVIGNETKIVVCGSDSGLAGLELLSAQNNLNFESARRYSSNFLGDITLLRRAIFFLQIGGGGVSEYAWSSSIPLLDFNYPLPKLDWICKRMLGVQKNKFVSWANEYQILELAHKRKGSNFENDLNHFVDRLKELM